MWHSMTLEVNPSAKDNDDRLQIFDVSVTPPAGGETEIQRSE